MAFTQQLSGPLLHLAARPRQHPAAFRRRASPASACADCVRRAALLLPAAHARAARRGGAQLRQRGSAPPGAASEGDAPEGEPSRPDAPQQPPPPPTPAVAVALALLAFYRREISPLMPRSCRFLPSCSEYSIQAFKQFGFWRGGILTAWRLARCNPLNPAYGLDLPRWPPFGPADED